MRYEIQSYLCSGDWECMGDDYDTRDEAEQELKDFSDDCRHAVIIGNMDDFNADDWRVAESDDRYQIYLGCVEGTVKT